MSVAGGSASPRKPWENARTSSSGPSPFRPASESNNTTAVVESAGVADSGDNKNAAQNGAIVNKPSMPIRGYSGGGYNHNQYNSSYGLNSSYGGNYNSYGGYNSYNRGGYGMGGGMYGGGYGLGNSYNGGMYGSNYGNGMYGSGMYGSGYGMGMGGMGMGAGLGMGMGMGPMGTSGQGSPNELGDPNNPYDDNNPSGSGPAPSVWFAMLQKMHWMMVVFGNIVSLISENTQTFHVITTALYTFLDRSGMLAGFVLKLLRMWSRPRLQPKANTPALMGPKNAGNLQIEAPRSIGGAGGGWDNVWSNHPAG